MDEINKLMDEFGKQIGGVLQTDTAAIRAALGTIPLTDGTESGAEEAARDVLSGLMGLLDATDAYKAEYLRCTASIFSGLSKAAAFCAK